MVHEIEDGQRDEQLAAALAEFVDRFASGEDIYADEFLRTRSEFAEDLSPELQVFEMLGRFDDEPPNDFAVGPFELHQQIGRGAFGVVYEATDMLLGRHVALKLLHSRMSHHGRAKDRFLRGARAIARLRHPNIVQVYSADIEGDTPYIGMELVQGLDLEQVLASLSKPHANDDPGHGSPTTEPTNGFHETLRHLLTIGPDVEVFDEKTATLRLNGEYCRTIAGIFAGAADGLHHAHGEKVIHRDIKPSNLILDSEGSLRIVDFGLARVGDEAELTASHDLVGTVLYMSPEQASPGSSELDARTDIYSLGATLYKALCGKPPLDGRDRDEITHKLHYEDPTPLRDYNPDVPRDLETIVHKCLLKEPGNRYGTAEALAQELRRFVRGDPIEARPQRWSEKLVRRAWRNRRRYLEYAGVAALLFMVALLASNYLGGVQEEKRAQYEALVQPAAGLIAYEELRHAEATSRPRRAQEVIVEPEELYEDRHQGGVPRLYELGLDAGEIARQFEASAALLTDDLLDDAMTRLHRASGILDDDPHAFYYLARAQRLRGNDKAARESVGYALECNPGFLPAIGLRELMRNEEKDGPDEMLVRPEWDDSWLESWLRAKHAERNSKWAEAVQQYKAARDRLESDASYIGLETEIRLSLGAAALEAGQKNEALICLGSLLDDGVKECSLLLARTLYLGSDASRAEEYLRKWFNHSKSEDLHRALFAAQASCKLYRELGDLERALAWAETFREHDETNSSTGPMLVGTVLLEQERFDSASRAFEEAAERAPADARPVVAQGISFEARERYDEAEALYREAMTFDEYPAEAHYNLGRLLIQRERRGEAEAAYRRALQIDDEHALAHNNLGLLLDEDGRLGEAVEHYERAVEAAPDLAAAHFNFAWAAHRERRFADAAKGYKHALELGLDDAVVYGNLAPCLQYLLRLDEAIAAYEKAATLDPRNPVTWTSLGSAYHWRHFRGGPPENLERSRGAYAKAVQIVPGRADVRHELACRLKDLGREDEAVAEYRRVIDRHPDFHNSYPPLAELLLDRPLPPADQLPEAIRRFERAEPAKGGGPVGELLETYRQALLPDLVSCQSVDRLVDRALPGGASPSDEDRHQRAAELLDAQRAPAASTGEGVLAYLQGRLAQLEERTGEAIASFDWAVANGGCEPEPVLRLAEALIARERPVEAEGFLRQKLADGYDDPRLWDLWLHAAMVELGWPPPEIDLNFPRPAVTGGRGGDLRWLVDRLVAGEPLRINCGGTDYENDGIAWSHDRFFAPGPGRFLYLKDLDDRREQIEDTAVRLTTRVFWSRESPVPGYAIPLPSGTYRVTLEFIQGWDDGEIRSFDIWVEGERLREEYTLNKGMGIPVAEEFPEVEVDDGRLEIDFTRRNDDPEICALIVERLD